MYLYDICTHMLNTRKVLQVINEHKDHGILTVATVNDTEMLCDALKRSGRFDRILSIGLPDQKERQMIAAFYLKGKKVAHGVSISMISKMTSGMSGADIECIINEAGIHAVLEGSKEIRQSDIVFALDRKVFKAVSRENSWSPEQRRHTAVHESGHLVAALLLQPDDVTGATILPQGESEGHTVVAWDDEDIHNLATIQNRITILLAGKVSEQVFYPGETFLGDSQDLTTAMKLARNLVQEHGIYGYDLCYFSEHYYPDPISDEKLIRIEKKVADILKESADQARKLIEDKTKLTELKKAHKKVKKAEDDSVATIQKQLDLTDDEIKVNQTLVDSKETDAELIKSLKATIKELKENHGKLSRELEEKQLSIEALTKEHKTAEAELASQISEREEELKKANDTVRAYEEKQKETTTSFNLLLSQNAKQLSPVVQNVVKKYPAGSNIFFRYVSDISICLDSAVSASESNAFDEMGRCIDAIREMYRKTLQAVFDVTLQKNVQNLGSYLTDGFNLIAIENMFKQRKIPLDIRSKLVAFHALANAIGHSLENGPRKKDNDKRVANFKKLGKVEREKILLAVPNFFNSLNCTKNEVADINKKLKV